MWTPQLWFRGGGRGAKQWHFAVVVVIVLHRLTAMGVDTFRPGTGTRALHRLANWPGSAAEDRRSAAHGRA
eukprot:6165310-Pyramimonas_sp.AAC.1